jgi:hypothetical protein
MPKPLKTKPLKHNYQKDENLSVTFTINHDLNQSPTHITHTAHGNLSGIIAELSLISEFISRGNTFSQFKSYHFNNIFNQLNPQKFIFTKHVHIRSTKKAQKSDLIDEGLSLLLRKDVPLTKPTEELLNSLGVEHLFDRFTERGKKRYLLLPKEVRRYWTDREKVGK